MRWDDAVEHCATVWASVWEARAMARLLESDGWLVEVRVPGPDRPDGIRVYASVYHRRTYRSPGDIRYRHRH